MATGMATTPASEAATAAGPGRGMPGNSTRGERPMPAGRGRLSRRNGTASWPGRLPMPSTRIRTRSTSRRRSRPDASRRKPAARWRPGIVFQARRTGSRSMKGPCMVHRAGNVSQARAGRPAPGPSRTWSTG